MTSNIGSTGSAEAKNQKVEELDGYATPTDKMLNLQNKDQKSPKKFDLKQMNLIFMKWG